MEADDSLGTVSMGLKMPPHIANAASIIAQKVDNVYLVVPLEILQQHLDIRQQRKREKTTQTSREQSETA